MYNVSKARAPGERERGEGEGRERIGARTE